MCKYQCRMDTHPPGPLSDWLLCFDDRTEAPIVEAERLATSLTMARITQFLIGRRPSEIAAGTLSWANSRCNTVESFL
jgi:hypothetical protein